MINLSTIKVFNVMVGQGWRKNMEDAHLALLDIHQTRPNGVAEDTKIRLFGVFDGHGGRTFCFYTSSEIN